jgi:hypothetical protein
VRKIQCDRTQPELTLGVPNLEEPVARRPRRPPGTGDESAEIARRLGSFKYAETAVFTEIRRRFPTAINGELVGIAQTVIYVARQRGIPHPDSFTTLDRITRRSLPLMVKWFHDYWLIIWPILSDVVLADASFAIISNSPEISGLSR